LQVVCKLTGHAKPITALALAPGEEGVLLSGDAGGNVSVWRKVPLSQVVASLRSVI
jgi:hypothetical protein